jgi:hypothetical protein
MACKSISTEAFKEFSIVYRLCEIGEHTHDKKADGIFVYWPMFANSGLQRSI